MSSRRSSSERSSTVSCACSIGPSVCGAGPRHPGHTTCGPGGPAKRATSSYSRTLPQRAQTLRHSREGQQRVPTTRTRGSALTGRVPIGHPACAVGAAGRANVGPATAASLRSVRRSRAMGSGGRIHAARRTSCCDAGGCRGCASGRRWLLALSGATGCGTAPPQSRARRRACRRNKSHVDAAITAAAMQRIRTPTAPSAMAERHKESEKQRRIAFMGALPASAWLACCEGPR